MPPAPKPVVYVRPKPEEFRKLEAENEYLKALLEKMTQERDQALAFINELDWHEA